MFGDLRRRNRWWHNDALGWRGRSARGGANRRYRRCGLLLDHRLFRRRSPLDMGHMRSRARCLCGRGVVGMRVRMGVARLVINQAKQFVVEVIAHG